MVKEIVAEEFESEVLGADVPVQLFLPCFLLRCFLSRTN